jgi:hypothetical protein
VTETTLDLLERAIANGSAELILACSTPHGALAQAETIMATDLTAARDFGNARALALYVRSMAMPQRLAALRAVERPNDPPAIPSCPAAALHALQAEARRCPPAPAAPPVEVRAVELAAAPACEGPLAATQTVALAHPTTTATKANARVSLAALSATLGLPLDDLPRPRLLLALKEAGLAAQSDEHGEPIFDDGKAAALAADREAVGSLLVRLTQLCPRLGFVSSGAPVFGR